MKIEDIISDLPIQGEDIKIKVGRDVIWPRRKGLAPPTEKQLNDLKTALEAPEKTKGTVTIQSGDEVAYKVQKGKVLTPWEEKTVTQQNLFEPEIHSSPEIFSEKAESFDSQVFPVSQEPSGPLTPNIDVESSENLSPQIKIELGESGFKSFSEDATVISARGDVSKENLAAVKLYDELLTQHPQSEGLNRQQLLLAPVENQMKADRQVLEMAFRDQMHPDTFDRILGQGSPRVQSQLAIATPSEITEYQKSPGISSALQYQVELSREYYGKTQSAVLEGQTQPKALQEPAITVSSEVVTEQDFRFDAGNPSPLAPIQSAIASSEGTRDAIVGSVKSSINSIKGKIAAMQSAHENLSKISAKTTAENLKQWAEKQMPVMKESVVKLATEKGPAIRDWAFKNYPDLAQAAQKTYDAGKSTRQFVHDVQQNPKGMVAKGAEIAAKKAKVVAGKAAVAIDHKIKEIPKSQIQEIEHAVRDAIVIGSQGKSDSYSTEKFNYSISPDNKVNVSLNDGENTPVLRGSEINYDVSWKDLSSLQKLPEVMNTIRQDISQQKTAQQYRQSMMEV